MVPYGTNLYKLCDDFWDKRSYEMQILGLKGTGECERIAALSKYNEVTFDGYKYDHGMSMDDDRWFYETRVNQVMFLMIRRPLMTYNSLHLHGNSSPLPEEEIKLEDFESELIF